MLEQSNFTVFFRSHFRANEYFNDLHYNKKLPKRCHFQVVFWSFRGQKMRVLDTLRPEHISVLTEPTPIHYTQQTDVLTEYKKENNFNNYYV